MQKTRGLKVFLIVAMLAFAMTGFVSAAHADVQPGDVISKANVDKVKDLFPPSMLRWFTDGWKMEPAVTIKVVAPTPNMPPRAFQDETRKNAARVTLTADGKLRGYTAGLPFPDPQEPNKALKIMWNNYYRWRGDDFSYPGGFMVNGRKKGSSISYGLADIHFLRFTGRTNVKPVPNLPNPHNLEWAYTLDSLAPPEWKGMLSLVWRYNDPDKPDDMWTYLPTMRRTLRMVSRERSNPVRGTTSTMDDYYGFDGKISEFTYKLVGEQKVLAVMNQSNINIKGEHPILSDNYELRDCYVLDITSKDSRYPERVRRVWVTKDIYFVIYSESWDKSGTFWKGIVNGFRKFKLPNGEYGPFETHNAAIDYKTSTWTGNYIKNLKLNNSRVKAADMEPSALGARGQ